MVRSRRGRPRPRLGGPGPIALRGQRSDRRSARDDRDRLRAVRRARRPAAPASRARDLAEAPSLLVATAILAWVARDSKVSAWLLFACALFAVDLYWLAQSLPRPPSLTDGSWVAVYGPLPLVFGLVGLGLRSFGGRGWGWPLYRFA